MAGILLIAPEARALFCTLGDPPFLDAARQKENVALLRAVPIDGRLVLVVERRLVRDPSASAIFGPGGLFSTEEEREREARQRTPPSRVDPGALGLREVAAGDRLLAAWNSTVVSFECERPSVLRLQGEEAVGEIDRCDGLTKTVLPDGTLKVTNTPQHLPLRELIGRVLQTRAPIDCGTEPIAAPGHSWSGTLRGRVIARQGDAIPGVEIVFRADHVGWTAGITTDADGRFTVTGLPEVGVRVAGADLDLELPRATSELELVVSDDRR